MRYKEYDEMQLNYYHFFIVITTLKGGEKAKEGQNYCGPDERKNQRKKESGYPYEENGNWGTLYMWYG